MNVLQEQLGEVNDCFFVFPKVYLKPILLTRIQPLLYSDFRYLKVSFLLFQPNQFLSSWNQFLGFVSWEGTVRVWGRGYRGCRGKPAFSNQTTNDASEIPTVVSLIGGL